MIEAICRRAFMYSSPVSVGDGEMIHLQYFPMIRSTNDIIFTPKRICAALSLKCDSRALKCDSRALCSQPGQERCNRTAIRVLPPRDEEVVLTRVEFSFKGLRQGSRCKSASRDRCGQQSNANALFSRLSNLQHGVKANDCFGLDCSDPAHFGPAFPKICSIVVH